MRVVVTGATGNVGTSLLRALARSDRVEEIVGLARREPQARWDKVRWVAADVGRDALRPHIEGADAVVHLAWRIQPSRDRRDLWTTNVLGSRRVFDAAAQAGVPALIHMSSVGAYSPGPKDRMVDEGWPVEGVPGSTYSSHKAEAERALAAVRERSPGIRVVTMRPGLIFKREAASGMRRLFAGPLLPGRFVAPGRLPFLPDAPGLVLQAVHSDDVARAIVAVVERDVCGAFNLAADPVLDPPTMAAAVDARTVAIPAWALRALARATYGLRLQPSEPGWVDLALRAPLLDSARARRELGWAPSVDARSALREVLAGIADAADGSTPPLAAGTSGRLRRTELQGAMGRREVR